MSGMYTEMNLNRVKKGIMASLNISVGKQVIVIVIFLDNSVQGGKVQRGRRQGLRFIVRIREDLNV